MTDTPTPSPSLLQTTLQEVRARIDGELPQQHGIQVVGLGGEVSAKLLPQAPVILPPEVPMRHTREYAPGCAAEPLLTAASST